MANIKTKNLVPLASGAVLMNTFRAFCLDGDPSVTARTARGFGRRAMCRLAAGGTVCALCHRRRHGPNLWMMAVCAAFTPARTGQGRRCRQRIAQWFPKAQPVASDDPLQTIWTTGRAYPE